MPEGPETRRQVDQIANVIEKLIIDDIVFGLPALEMWQEAFVGQRVENVTCHGKAVLIRCSNGKTIYTHNQLYGKWVVCHQYKARPASTRQLRIAIDTQAGSALLYSASDIEVWDTDRLHLHPFLTKLGPDILDEKHNVNAWLVHARQSQFQRKHLGGLLLAQSFLAGMGNYLRSEALFFSGLMPHHTLNALTDHQLTQLLTVIRSIALNSYHTEGMTLNKQELAKQKQLYSHFEDYRFAVFDREAKPCIRCGTKINKMQSAGRRLYYCEKCQN